MSASIGEQVQRLDGERSVSAAASKERLGASTGETTAPAAVYERVAPVVRRMVWFYAGSDPEREDIVQDALLSILRNEGSVTDSEQLEAWAARVAFNTICSVFRRRKLRRSLPLDALGGAEPPARESDFEARETLARVRRVLERLPRAERVPLTMELLENASQEEIARRLGCSTRTVRRRLKNARLRFMGLARADPSLKSRVRGT